MNIAIVIGLSLILVLQIYLIYGFNISRKVKSTVKPGIYPIGNDFQQTTTSHSKARVVRLTEAHDEKVLSGIE